MRDRQCEIRVLRCYGLVFRREYEWTGKLALSCEMRLLFQRHLRFCCSSPLGRLWRERQRLSSDGCVRVCYQ